jgi:hypothetical protein
MSEELPHMAPPGSVRVCLSTQFQGSPFEITDGLLWARKLLAFDFEHMQTIMAPDLATPIREQKKLSAKVKSEDPKALPTGMPKHVDAICACISLTGYLPPCAKLSISSPAYGCRAMLGASI